MTRPFEVHLPLEQAYLRKALFAVEVLDAVTLSRVSEGLKVVAEGLPGEPYRNAGGLFVWLGKDIAPLKAVTVDPGLLPYEKVVRPRPDLQTPLTTIELPPGTNYPFAAGITGLRGTLIESRAPQPPVPIPGAVVSLRWLDHDDNWQDAKIASRTDAHGDFVVVLRLARTEVPHPPVGAFTVRLRARRDPLTRRDSADLKLPEGRVADPSTFDPNNPGALVFAWDELQP